MLLVNLHEKEVDLPLKELAQEWWQEANCIIHRQLAKSQFERRRDLDINHSLVDVLSGQYTFGDGKSLIVLFTGKRYPVYLFHWHPAKSQFEWRRDLDINHSLADVLSGQYFANFLIQKGELGKRF